MNEPPADFGNDELKTLIPSSFRTENARLKAELQRHKQALEKAVRLLKEAIGKLEAWGPAPGDALWIKDAVGGIRKINDALNAKNE